MVRSETGLPLGPTPARAPRPDEPVPVALRQRGGLAVPPEEPEEHPRRGPVGPLGALRLRGRHLFPVDVKKRPQRQRLRFGVLPAVRLRFREPGGELVRLPLGPLPVTVPQRPGQPSAVLPPLDLVHAGLRVGKHPDAVPAPLAGAIAPALTFRACHHSIPLD